MLLPQSLLWRSFVLIALLLIISQTLWWQITRLYAAEPQPKQVAQQIISVINVTRAALINAQREKRRDLLLELSAREGIRIYPAAANEAPLSPLARPFLRKLRGEIQAQLGEHVELTTERRGIPGLWVSFYIEDDAYWVMFPRDRFERPSHWVWLGWGALLAILSLLGAYLIVYRVNHPLRVLAAAAEKIGRGEKPLPMSATGPLEISNLSLAFNHMATNLERANADKTLFLAGVSHDLRTPLARLRLGIEMLGSGVDERLKNAMTQDIEDLDAIIAQFLVFAREEESEPTVMTDLNKIIEEVCERYQRTGKTLRCELHPLPFLALRPLAMSRMLTNLLENAFSYGGKEIEIQTQQNQKNVIVTVLDRGPGIPEAEIPRVTLAFARLDEARSGHAGAGLGLAIVERIIKMHGGRLSLQNRLGGGLQVEVSLPLDAGVQGQI